MGKKEKMDKNKENRLAKLFKEWEKAGEELNFFDSPEKLTILDLRLLLENPSPLQELIRHIVAEALNANSAQPREPSIAPAAPETHAEDAQALQDARQALERAKDELTKTQTELTETSAGLQKTQTTLESTRNELAQAQEAQAAQNKAMKELADKAKQAEVDLKACSTKVERLLKKESDNKQEIKKLEDERKQLQAALEHAESLNKAAPALTFLRSDLQLAQAMGLDDLPADDTQALIQTVAVLAQLDNLKRLWEVLKDRCETDNRPASANENALLQVALDWHNHNWRSLPYRLINPAPASRYDYQTQLRSSHVTKGETVAATHLPGIADGSGKALCKALVQTK